MLIKIKMIELIPTQSIYKPNIFFDIDGIVADTRRELSKYCSEKLGLKISSRKLEKTKLSEIVGIPKDKCRKLITDFYLTRQETFETMPGAKYALQKLSKKYNINLISGRPIWSEEPTVRWVEKKLSGLISRVFFSRAHDIETPGYRRTKGEICREFYGEFLVDDDSVYSLECANRGTNVLYFHGDKEIIHPKIIKVLSWQEIMEYGMGRIK
mgnify:CR=1 FL=1